MATTVNSNQAATNNSKANNTNKTKRPASNSQISTTSSSTSSPPSSHIDNDDHNQNHQHRTSSSKDSPSSPKFFNSHNCSIHNHNVASASLTASLSSYKYLDDYEYYREERMKQKAMRNFGLILQSIKTKYKGCASQSAYNDENSDSDIIEDTTSEFSDFNRILRRHRKRFKRKPASHHHR